MAGRWSRGHASTERARTSAAPIREGATKSLSSSEPLEELVRDEIMASLDSPALAEALRRVMSRYFDEMRSVLERHGGDRREVHR